MACVKCLKEAHPFEQEKNDDLILIIYFDCISSYSFP